MTQGTESLPLAPTDEQLRRQLDELPEGVTGEILRPGRIETMGRPGKAHRRAAQVLFDRLRGRDQSRGGQGWWVEVEAEILFRSPQGFSQIAVPDLSGWRVEQVPELPEDNPLTLAPHWVCEVLSPSTERKDRAWKLPLYATQGIGHIWLVHPEHRLIEVYEGGSGRPVLVASAGDEAAVELAPFTGSPFDVTALWLPSPG